MTSSLFWRTAPLLASLALGTLALTGCDSGSSFDDTPPEPISVAAFAVNDDEFPQDNARTAGLTAGEAFVAASATAGANYAAAAGRVAVVTTLVGANLVIPKIATDAVTEATPVVTDGVWLWETTADVFGTPVELRLTADPDGSEIDWTLTSQDLSDPANGVFTYYTATTSTDGETGTWRLFLPNQDGVVLTADFDVRDLNDREVTFSVPAARGERGGSTVTYRTQGSTQTFDLTLQPGNDRATVRWDLQTRAGSIVADTFRGGERECWDSSLRNTSCS